MVIISILVFLLIFSVLILVHEFGHFLAARASGVKVEAFALGMGKKLWGKQIGETEYRLNAVPFGGYCQMLGEEESSDDPRSFEKARWGNRVMITLAGIFFNYVFSILALTAMFSVGTSPIFVSQADVDRAEASGVITFSEPAEDGTRTVLSIEKVKKPFPQSFVFAIAETGRISKGIIEKVSEIPGEIIEKHQLPDGLSGPVGIAEATHKILPGGFWALLKLAALLSLSLGVINLLPIPALDGGRFLFQIVELLLMPFGIKLNQKIENYIHYGGYILLMGLIVVVTWNDIARLIF